MIWQLIIAALTLAIACLITFAIDTLVGVPFDPGGVAVGTLYVVVGQWALALAGVERPTAKQSLLWPVSLASAVRKGRKRP